jgi:hypothetical protein
MAGQEKHMNVIQAGRIYRQVGNRGTVASGGPGYNNQADLKQAGYSHGHY